MNELYVSKQDLGPRDAARHTEVVKTTLDAIPVVGKRQEYVLKQGPALRAAARGGHMEVATQHRGARRRSKGPRYRRAQVDRALSARPADHKTKLLGVHKGTSDRQYDVAYRRRKRAEWLLGDNADKSRQHAGGRALAMATMAAAGDP